MTTQTITTETITEAMITHRRVTGRWHWALDQAMACLDQHEPDSPDTVAPLLVLGQRLLDANRPHAARFYLERARAIVVDHALYVIHHPDQVITLATALHAADSPITRLLLDTALARLIDVDDRAAERVRLLIQATAQADTPPPRTRQPRYPTARESGYGRLLVLPPPAVALSPATYRALADAQEALGRLDEVIHVSPLRAWWARSVQVREIQRSAHLDGVHVALREVLLAALPRGSRTQRVSIEPDLADYLCVTDLALGSAASGELLERTAARAAEDARGRGYGGAGNTVFQHLLAWNHDATALPVIARLALTTCYLQGSELLHGRAAHAGRLYLGTELVRGGLLREPWFPLASWMDTHRERYRKHIDQAIITGEVDELIRFFAHGVAATCRSERTLLAGLHQERERLLAALLPGGLRGGRIRDVVTSLVAVPLINNRGVAERYDIAASSAKAITTYLADHGLVVLLDGARYGKIYCCADALQMLVAPDTT
ncbi:MAG TPA: hypothetical protein VFX16_12630 [Pseudonocardiaceae bacterium]|nr:hypothetical protein [Pseudonocardiaceae bacterium]